MSKTVTPEVFAKLKDIKSKSGYTFSNAIMTGVETTSSVRGFLGGVRGPVLPCHQGLAQLRPGDPDSQAGPGFFPGGCPAYLSYSRIELQ